MTKQNIYTKVVNINAVCVCNTNQVVNFVHKFVFIKVKILYFPYKGPLEIRYIYFGPKDVMNKKLDFESFKEFV